MAALLAELPKAAKRLGASPSDVEAASQQLWGHSFGTEREQRLNVDAAGGDTPETRRRLQAQRGHTSRRLIEELRSYFTEEQS